MIRPATAEDLPAVLALEHASFTEPFWAERDFRAAMVHDGAMARTLLVDVEDGQLRGFGVATAITALYPVEAEVQNLAVAEPYRRAGVGRALMLTLLRWAVELGSGIIRLEVRASNAGAIRLYERLGFAVAGRRAAYYRNPLEDALLMEMRPGGGG